MVKILAIGDFHGKFPVKLKKIANRKDIDLILSVGDYADGEKIRKIIFKHWTDKPWYDVVGLKKAKKLRRESFNSGLFVLKELNKLRKKVYTIFGNLDFYKEGKTSDPDSLMPGFYEDKIKKMKNINLIERKKTKINGIEILGHGEYLDVTEFIKNPIDKTKEKQKQRLKRYRQDEKELKKLFLKKKPKKGFIFLIHYPVYGYFDKVNFKSSPMNGKHVGFEPYNNIIKKYKPKLVICGHMHEHQGKKKFGDGLIVSTGDAQKGKAAIIDFDEKKGKVRKVEFIK